MNTIECAAVMCWSARPVRSGNPTTTPSETMASDRRSAIVGLPWRTTARQARAMQAAMVARADVTNRGDRLPTATRVAGSVPLKMTTPMRPLSHPSVV